MTSRKLPFTWTLMKYALGILREDKELIVYTALSGLLCCGFFVAIFYGDFSGFATLRNEPQTSTWLFRGKLFLFLFWEYLLITFFNAAIIGAVMIRLRGGTPTLADGFGVALSRLPWIAGWALISATVLMVLRIVENVTKSTPAALIRSGVEIGWALASFLVVPLVVVERTDPLTALKESSRLIRKTWGHQVVANFSFGLVKMLFIAPAVFAAILVSQMEGYGTADRYFLYGLVVLYVIAVYLIFTTLETIFVAALYCHVRKIETPGQMLPAIAGAAMSNVHTAPKRW